MKRNLPLLVALLSCLGIGAMGCSSSSGSQQSDTWQPTDVYTEPDWQGRYDWGQPALQPTCQTPTNRLLHLASWPGLGVGMVVGPRTTSGAPLEPLADGWYTLKSLWEVPIPLETAPVSMDREYLLILLNDFAGEPFDRQALSEVVASQPAHVAVALFDACDRAVQIAGFGSERARVLDGLGAPTTCTGQADTWEVLAAAVTEAEHIGGPVLPAVRTVVLVSGELGNPPAPHPFAGTPVAVVHLAPGGIESDFPVTTVADLDTLKTTLEANRQGLYRLGGCPDMAPEEAVQLTTEDGADCPLLLPEGPGELESMACDASAIAAGEPAYPHTVELLFSPEERAVYDAKVMAKDQEDFELQIKLGDAPPVAATAHLRGQTSLDCQRKSYTVNMKGNRGRHILPGSTTDEYYLIAMCKDDRYFQQYTANILASQHGLFPLKFGLVELFLDGETRGVYLLLEKTKEALLEDHSRVHTVIRRRFDPGDSSPDVNYPPETDIDDPAGAAYLALPEQASTLSGEALIAEMNRRMDFDQFLRLLAFQTLLGNGDYVDEMIFWSTEAVRGGETLEWFQVMAWDMDDLFSACHHSGKHAMEDEYNILYCAEGNIEKAVMVDDAVYARFVEHLEALLQETLTTDHLEAALAQTEADLLPFFDDPDVCAAMTALVEENPDAVDPEVAKADILAHMDTLRDQYSVRSEKLTNRIAAYREATGQ